MRHILQIIPMGAPRMTQRDRWAQRPAVMRYWSYRDAIHEHMSKKGWTVGQELIITFLIPMPGSWSNKKRERMNKSLHNQKPDIDNLIKGFLDATLEDDKKVAVIHAYKFWSYIPNIIIEV